MVHCCFCSSKISTHIQELERRTKSVWGYTHVKSLESVLQNTSSVLQKMTIYFTSPHFPPCLYSWLLFAYITLWIQNIFPSPWSFITEQSNMIHSVDFRIVTLPKLNVCHISLVCLGTGAPSSANLSLHSVRILPSHTGSGSINSLFVYVPFSSRGVVISLFDFW